MIFVHYPPSHPVTQELIKRPSVGQKVCVVDTGEVFIFDGTTWIVDCTR